MFAEVRQKKLLVPLVAEEAAVFGRVVLGQGRFPFRRVAFFTGFFRFFFVHFHEPGMFLVVRQVFGCLFGGVVEKEKDSTAHDEKNEVVEEEIFAFCFWGFIIHFASPFSVRHLQHTERY